MGYAIYSVAEMREIDVPEIEQTLRIGLMQGVLAVGCQEALLLPLGDSLTVTLDKQVEHVLPSQLCHLRRIQGQVTVESSLVSVGIFLTAHPGSGAPTYPSRQTFDLGRYVNRWQIGGGDAPFHSDMLSFGYLEYEDHDQANAGFGQRYHSHRHVKAREFYTVIAGEETHFVEGQRIQVPTGYTLEISPGTCHTPIARQTPFKGFTLRFPMTLSDKEPCG